MRYGNIRITTNTKNGGVTLIKTIYLIRHSMTGVNIKNYENYKNVPWEEYNRNMILSVQGEEKAKKLCDIEELNNIDELYASSSPRAIATAKYLADKKNLSIKLDKRINEIDFDVEYYREMPDDFNKQMFGNKNLKLNTHESFNDMDKRVQNFINEVLNGEKESAAVVIHGIILLSYLGSIATETFDGKKFNITFNGKEILNGTPTVPDIYKITYEDKKVIDIERINLDN